ncbi:MAG: hypothetical protein FJ253_12465, partial [Phycisphaerae bacterium]|nr:hypothetical protein [Phycisphaerae bacterium]
MTILLAVPGVAILALLVLSRLLVLAPWPAGRLMYLANVVLETFEKRSHQRRAVLDAALLAAAATLIGLAFASIATALAVVGAYLLLVLENLVRERRVLREVHASQETVGLQRSSAAEPGFPSPGLHPRLSLNLEGPFVARSPAFDLGTPIDGVPIVVTLLVGNHSRVPCQTPVRVELAVGPGWRVQGEPATELAPLPSGRVERVRWSLVPSAGGAAGASAGGSIRLRVRASRFDASIEVRHAAIRSIGADEVVGATITRYPGARRAAFAWRGDMDLYDTATFQTIEGLEHAFGLGARYGVAQTMYLSTRLSLDPAAARRWAEHYGVARGAGEIPAFIEWMRSRVELRHSAPYPAVSERPYVIELGNHGHLHYATDTSGDPGNDWKAGARAGHGAYAWQGSDRSSFGDQR